MSRLITTETPEQARARINRQLIAQGGVPHSVLPANPHNGKTWDTYEPTERQARQADLSEVEQAIADCDRALDAAKNAVARCKALGVIQ